MVNYNGIKFKKRLTMKKNQNRSGRIADQVQKDIMEILRYKVKDPRVNWVTINDVEVTDDYSVAKIYWTVLDDVKRSDVELALESSKGFIRGLLSKGFRTYTIPQLKFIYDESLVRGTKILELINKVNKDNKDNSFNEGDGNDETIS